MNYDELGSNSTANEPYRRRTMYALYKSSVDVMAEVSSTANHALRVTYAAKVLSGQADVTSAVLASFTNATLAAAASPQAITDGDLQFSINSAFNALAGIGT